MDPYLKLFGRRVFEGTGRTSDVFGSPPDLSYLQDQIRPEFIPDEHGYDPSLNPENLVRSGMPVDFALQLQGVRSQLHQQAQKDRIRQDGAAAMAELQKVDFGSPKSANKLVEIFRKYPNARKNPEVVDSLNFFQKLKPQGETMDLEEITDPIIYNKAVAEGWDKLPKSQAARKIAGEEHNRKVLAAAIEAGMAPEDLADTFDEEAGVYDQYKADYKIKQGRYDPTKEEDPRIARIAILEKWNELPKSEAMRRRYIADTNSKIEDIAEESGVSVDDIAEFKDESGLYDPGKVKGYLRTHARKPLSDTLRKDVAKYKMEAAKERAELVSEEGKLAWLQQQYGDPTRTDFPKEEWDEAYRVLSQTKTPSEIALEEISGLRDTGNELPVFDSPEALKAGGLKKGDLFRTPDGAIRRME